MNSTNNPAFAAFLQALETETVFCQVWIARGPRGFLMRHVDDRALQAESLQLVPVDQIRALAQFTQARVFRPLKSAPNLRRGWRTELGGDAALWQALNSLYPGAVADWFAVQLAEPPVTSYREFTARQTGMYRITATLADEPARAAVAACCHEDFCWKRRLWTLDGLTPDPPERKSVIPCLEPCAVMLEFARKVARWEQGAHSDEAVGAPEEGPRAECDFDAPRNPRRLRFILEKQRGAATSPN